LIEDLFVDGALRLWEDDDGWSGYLIEDDQYYYVNTHHEEDDWISKIVTPGTSPALSSKRIDRNTAASC
jgi:hypothetical protein